ncbi:hypothetical protein GCM10009654_22850 [Streptomyces hebeiensis]|uniref:Uncharacterized protein n=1 Tax=Streptomyces hebeiensis TaxID=229486 RepID=A0ABN1UTF9_9ACTN
MSDTTHSGKSCLAQAAVAGGADLLGVAGGDGTQGRDQAPPGEPPWALAGGAAQPAAGSEIAFVRPCSYLPARASASVRARTASSAAYSAFRIAEPA